MSHRFSFATSCLALTFAAFNASAAHAQTVYQGLDDPRGARANSLAARASFLSALASYGTDDIEAYAPNAIDPTLSFGTTSVTAQTDVNKVYQDAAFATSGVKSLSDRIGADRFTFSAPVTAFGFDLIDAGTFTTAVLTLRLQNTSTNTSKDVTYTFSSRASKYNTLFWGVTDTDSFDQVLVLTTQEQDGILFDDVTVGFLPTASAAAPEPGSIALLLSAGVPVAGLVRRRRNRYSVRVLFANG